VAHAAATIEVEHERDVFQEQPAWTALPLVEEPEDVIDETGVAPPNASGHTRLAEVLAGEPSGDQVDIAERLKVAHVWCHLKRESIGQDLGSTGIRLAQEGGHVAGSVQPELNATNPREEPRDS
jgi:hypothetical protein